jgi:hypothetical protein
MELPNLYLQVEHPAGMASFEAIPLLRPVAKIASLAL